MNQHPRNQFSTGQGKQALGYMRLILKIEWIQRDKLCFILKNLQLKVN